MNSNFKKHMTPSHILDERLKCAASFVRKGKIAADIGTDHAYIPIYLLTNGICIKCVASDINFAPLEKAEKNIARYKISDKVELIQTDGLHGIGKTGAEDIIICGMGGDLIRSIICQAEFVFDKKINLILQPMSKAGKLREYLSETGFCICEEKLVKSRGKIYQCMKASWTGEKYTLSAAETLIGRHNIKRGETGDNIFTELVDMSIETAERRIQGKIKGGLEIERESELLSELGEIRRNI